MSFPIPTVVARMRADFAKAKNTDVTFTIFPGAEHQLMVPQEYDGRRLRNAMSPAFLPTMVDWIKGHIVKR